MKLAAAAATTALLLTACMATTEAEAAEIGATGISVGAELDNRYNFDTETMTATLTPGFGYDLSGVSLAAEMDFILYENEFTLNNDELPTLDVGAEYGMTMWGLNSKVFAETGYDLEAERMEDIEVGISFSF